MLADKLRGLGTQRGSAKRSAQLLICCFRACLRPQHIGCGTYRLAVMLHDWYWPSSAAICSPMPPQSLLALRCPSSFCVGGLGSKPLMMHWDGVCASPCAA